MSYSLVSTYSCQVMCETEQKPASVMKTTQSSKPARVLEALPPKAEQTKGLLRNFLRSISIVRYSLVSAELGSISFRRLSSLSKMNLG